MELKMEEFTKFKEEQLIEQASFQRSLAELEHALLKVEVKAAVLEALLDKKNKPKTLWETMKADFPIMFCLYYVTFHTLYLIIVVVNNLVNTGAQP